MVVVILGLFAAAAISVFFPILAAGGVSHKLGDDIMTELLPIKAQCLIAFQYRSENSI